MWIDKSCPLQHKLDFRLTKEKKNRTQTPAKSRRSFKVACIYTFYSCLHRRNAETRKAFVCNFRFNVNEIKHYILLLSIFMKIQF